jgi:hypothetical protein
MNTKKLLTIIEQPEDNFWKDEGGKNSYLYVTLKYNGNSAINIPLIASLYYENGLKVEPQNEDILSLKDCENKKFQYNIFNKCKKVGFRINKVSRRLDNRKFFVKFEVDKENKNINKFLKKINSISTIPITVLSKRKIPASLRKQYSENPIKKRRVYSTQSDIKENYDKLNKELIEEMKKSNQKLIEEMKKSNQKLINEVVKLKKLLLKEKMKNTFGEPLVVNNFYGGNSIGKGQINITKTENHTPLGFFSTDHDISYREDYILSDVTNPIFMSDINPVFNKKDDSFDIL